MVQAEAESFVFFDSKYQVDPSPLNSILNPSSDGQLQLAQLRRESNVGVQKPVIDRFDFDGASKCISLVAAATEAGHALNHRISHDPGRIDL